MRRQSPHRYPSPLRYPGGKGKLTRYVAQLIHMNGMRDGEYVEPYAGGAGVALALLFEQHVRHVHINDVNRSVHTFWEAVLGQPAELAALVAETEVTIEEWERQREIQRDPSSSGLDLAFSTFFLNRTNRSGIVGGGVIGGLKQDGPYGLKARYPREALAERILKIGRNAARITLHNEDAKDFLQDVVPDLPVNTFLYLDPPYFEKGAGLYENAYGPAEHAEIASLIREVDRPWIVSYDNKPEIHALYKGLRSVEYDLCYSAADRYLGKEVMFFSPDMRIPVDTLPYVAGRYAGKNRAEPGLFADTDVSPETASHEVEALQLG